MHGLKWFYFKHDVYMFIDKDLVKNISKRFINAA